MELILRRTMGVSANGNLLTILNIDFHHGRLLLDYVHDSYYDLVNVFQGQLLAVLEAFDHVFHEF